MSARLRGRQRARIRARARTAVRSVGDSDEGPGVPAPEALALESLVAWWMPRWEADGAAPQGAASRAQNSGLSAGDPVVTLTDWGPGAHHLGQSDGARQPTWTDSTPDGALAVSFGGSQWVELATLELELDVWVLGLIKPSSSFGTVLEHGGSPGSQRGGLNADGMGCLARYGFNGDTLMCRRLVSGAARGLLGSAPPSTYQLVEWRSSAQASTRDILVDGVSVLSSAGQNSSEALLSGQVTVGAGATGDLARFSGLVGGLAIYTGDIDEAGKAAARAEMLGA